MSKPDNFILNSDYATLKNDARNSASVTFPGSQSIGANVVRSYQSTINLGEGGSSIRSRISSSKDSNNWYACTSIYYIRTGTVSGSPATYDLRGVITRTSPTEVTVIAAVLNPYGSTLVTASGDEVLSFLVNGFLPPFD